MFHCVFDENEKSKSQNEEATFRVHSKCGVKNGQIPLETVETVSKNLRILKSLKGLDLRRIFWHCETKISGKNYDNPLTTLF